MISLIPIEQIPEIRPGDDLDALLAHALRQTVPAPVPGDLLVVCQKIVSKAEGRIVDLRTIEPTPIERRTANELGKDVRLVALILRESRHVLRMERGHLIVETKHGFVCANAGIDESNSGDRHSAILLPIDPNASARRLQEQLRKHLGMDLPILITDTFGRAWREGQIDVAIGASGFSTLVDLRGQHDHDGHKLHHTLIALGDQLAAAAGILMGKNAGIPAVLISGANFSPGNYDARALIRDPKNDLFR